jgi:hypothetical protein
MLTALLKAPTGRKDREMSSLHFRSAGPTIYDADGHPIVMQQGGIWRTGGDPFISLDFQTPVTLHFKNEELGTEETFGPYERLRIINGGIWGYEDSPELVAQFDPALSLWHIVSRPSTGMPEVTIRSAVRK